MRLDIAYDGTAFHGWARQPGLRTVQGTLCEAIRTILAVEQPIDITCAGRTDAGVHARGQVAHVDVPHGAAEGGVLDLPTMVRRFAGVLPDDVVVREVRQVSEDFDARFSALSRRYAYRVADAPAARDPLRRFDVVDHPRSLDLEAMNSAAVHLLGEHDFAAFCRPRPPATTVRRLLTCSWERDAAGRAVLEIRADAFCHSMVRAIVGALVAVGDGRRDPPWVAGILAGRVRESGVTVMPARGLTLEEVSYPPPREWAARQRTTRTVRTPPTPL